jgi:hypothetical protein
MKKRYTVLFWVAVWLIATAVNVVTEGFLGKAEIAGWGKFLIAAVFTGAILGLGVATYGKLKARFEKTAYKRADSPDCK